MTQGIECSSNGRPQYVAEVPPVGGANVGAGLTVKSAAGTLLGEGPQEAVPEPVPPGPYPTPAHSIPLDQPEACVGAKGGQLRVPLPGTIAGLVLEWRAKRGLAHRLRI